LDIVERCVGRIVEALQAVLEILLIGSDLIDYEPCLLHYRSAMFKRAGYFFSGPFQGAVKAERLGQCRATAIAGANAANPRIGAIPLLWSIEDLFGALRNPQICGRDRQFDVVLIV